MKTFGNQIMNLRRGLSRIAILAVLALASVGLTQCRLVDDNVTGVELGPNTFEGRSACIHRCNDEFKAAMDTEDARHKAATRACNQITNETNRNACKKAEDAVHKTNKDRIIDAMQKCKAKCYNEGGGQGGR